jgi:hypothetical protein
VPAVVAAPLTLVLLAALFHSAGLRLGSGTILVLLARAGAATRAGTATTRATSPSAGAGPTAAATAGTSTAA